MTPLHELLPISETIVPASAMELAEHVRSCCRDDVAVYPVGGATSLTFGLPARKPGVALRLSGMQRVVDYPARDMTVTVEAGMTLRELASRLAVERQRLPIDVPQAADATIGGVIATNFNGPRRYGCGTVRDYVIGIEAVDGTGRMFKGGGRVVKNVAGYDFCKLLTGSLGTLGVITQVTLKVKPMCERQAVMVCRLADEQRAEELLAALVHSETMPAAIELLAGRAWQDDAALQFAGDETGTAPLFAAVAFEGTDPEVEWMVGQLGREWRGLGVTSAHTLLDAEAEQFVQRWTEFPASGPAALVLKASLTPSCVTRWMKSVHDLDPACSLLAHAGNGIVVARLDEPLRGGITKGLIGQLQSTATAAQGSLVVLAGTVGETTHQSVWGPLTGPQGLMKAVKREFDPQNILNPGRFVY